MDDKNVPVSDTDKLTEEGGRDADRTRNLGEFEPTNMPLSATEIEERGAEWKPRTLESVHEIEPLGEEDQPKP